MTKDQNTVSEITPDVIPEVKGKRRETLREELFRRCSQPRGKRKSRKPQKESTIVPLPLPANPPSKRQRGGRQVSAGTVAIDLNL